MANRAIEVLAKTLNAFIEVAHKTKTPKMTAKLFLLIVATMISVHLIVFAFYSVHSKRAMAKVNRDLMTRQIITLIQTIKQTDPVQRQDIVNDLYVPNLNVTIEPTSLYTPQFRQATIWTILQKINLQGKQIQFSLLLDDEAHWLNVSATVGPTSWGVQIILLILEVALLTAVFFSLWSISRFRIPLENFMKAAERLGLDLNAQPVSEFGPAIVRSTAQAINTMQERITDLIRERTQMIAAISHDLRTPITRLKLRAQFIEDPNLYQKMIQDLDEMEAMVAETLNFASDENKREKKVWLDLNALLQTLCSDMQDTGFSVEYTNPEIRLPLFGRPISLKRAFTNLIHNGVKYGDHVQVSIHKDQTNLSVFIEDEGPGLNDDQIKQVFEPFYRAESSRSRQTGGIGLGLAVVQDIICAHHGTVTLKRRTQAKGLCATVHFTHVEV